jgi:putative transposase
VTARSNNKEWFYIPLPEVWDAFTRSIDRAADRYHPEIHLLVLMSNHFHLVLSTPEENLDHIMRYLISYSTGIIQRSARRINHVFGARYRWSLLDSSFALAYVYKYVCRNPVRANICSNVEDYRYNTLNAPESGIPIVEGFDSYWRAIPRVFSERLRWLNQGTSKEREELIRKGLRRYRFKFSTDSNLQKNLRLLREDYGVDELRHQSILKVD